MNEIRSNDTPLASALPVLDRLDATHEQMRYWLGELQTLVNHMEDRGWDTWARDHARSVIDFFSRAARQHHQDIDRQVLPLAAARGGGDPDTLNAIERLRQNHGWIEENWSELFAQLQPVAEGFGGCDPDTLRHGAEMYDALLREHVELEKVLLYPAARAQVEAEGRGEATRRATA